MWLFLIVQLLQYCKAALHDSKYYEQECELWEKYSRNNLIQVKCKTAQVTKACWNSSNFPYVTQLTDSVIILILLFVCEFICEMIGSVFCSMWLFDFFFFFQNVAIWFQNRFGLLFRSISNVLVTFHAPLTCPLPCCIPCGPHPWSTRWSQAPGSQGSHTPLWGNKSQTALPLKDNPFLLNYVIYLSVFTPTSHWT